MCLSYGNFIEKKHWLMALLGAVFLFYIAKNFLSAHKMQAVLNMAFDRVLGYRSVIRQGKSC